MNNADILDHLFEIEAKAESLVSDANIEADRRISEAEKQNRTAAEIQYQEGAAIQEAEYQQEINQTRESCQKELEAFCKKIDAINADNVRFSAVLNSLFAGEE